MDNIEILTMGITDVSTETGPGLHALTLKAVGPEKDLIKLFDAINNGPLNTGASQCSCSACMEAKYNL